MKMLRFILYTMSFAFLMNVCQVFVLGAPKTPKLLWPLDNRTCEQEVKMINTFEPHLFCNHTFVNQTYDIPYTAMVLDKHIDVRVEFTPEKKGHYSFGGMFLPRETSGVIFHYKSNSSSSEVMLSIDNGTLNLYRKHDDDTGKIYMYTNNTIMGLEANKWVWITTAVGKGGRVFVNIGNERVIRQRDQKAANRKIELPGNLRIGGSFNISRLPFNGLVSCVGFFVKEIFPRADSILPLCHAWQVFVLGAPKTPKLLWPLDNRTCEQEVKMINTFEPHLFCNHTFVNQTYDIPYTAMVLDKHIDVRVEFTPEKKGHYSFGGMFLPKETSGVIFHYKSDSSSSETMLSIDNGTLNLYRKHDDDTGTIYTNNTMMGLKANNWVWITTAVGKGGFVHVNIGKERVIRQRDQKAGKRKIELPGNLRIGGSFNISRLPFNGLVSCVGFFVKERFPRADSILPLCHAWQEKYEKSKTLSAQTAISMDTTTAIPDSKTDTEQQTLKCFCPCNLGKWTVSDKEEIIRHFKDILHVDKRKTSNFLRRKTSAPDDRISAKSVGFVGIVFLVLPFALIVIFDCCGRRIPN